MIKNYFTGILFTGVLLITFSPVYAESYCLKDKDIKWDHLKLSNKQKAQIQNLDQQWKEVSSIIHPKLVRDKERLKLMMFNADVSDNDIREVQKQIIAKQDQLRYEALENFLAKRRVLTQKQREMLHKMLPK